MTLDEAILKHKGTWDGDFALIKDRGYTFKVAKKTDAGIELLFDAKRFITPESSEPAKVAEPKPTAKPRKGAVINLDPVPADPAAEEGE